MAYSIVITLDPEMEESEARDVVEEIKTVLDDGGGWKYIQLMRSMEQIMEITPV